MVETMISWGLQGISIPGLFVWGNRIIPWLGVGVGVGGAGGGGDTLLRVASSSILSRDPDLSRKPPKTLGKQLVVEKNYG